jgi:flagellar biosynthesis protein FlhA
LGADRYEIHIDGVLSGRGEARAECLLAIHPSGDVKLIPGEVTRDPTYGLPALWIDRHQRDAALASRYTIVDADTLMITHLTEVLKRDSATLLNRAETERLLARVRQQQPTLVEDIVPTVLAVSDIQRVLQGLLREKVSIRHIEAILETLADAGRATKDVGLLIERVRQRLGHAICQSLVGENKALQVLTLDPGIESQLLHGMRSGNGQAPAVDPKLAEQLMARLVQQAERMMGHNLLPVLLCSPDLRRHMRALSERVLPHLRVLAMTEVPQTLELKSYAVVGH